MKGFINWLENSFAPKANAIFKNPWIAGFSSAMQKVIPFILTGSVIFLYNVLVSYFPALPDITPVMSYTFGLLSLLITFFYYKSIDGEFKSSRLYN